MRTISKIIILSFIAVLLMGCSDVGISPEPSTKATQDEKEMNDANGKIKLGYNYTKDDNHVYRNDVLIPELDPETFEIIKDDIGGDCGYFIKDEDSLFFENEGKGLKKIEEKNIEPLMTIKIDNARYYKGEKDIYILGPNWGGCIIDFIKIEGVDLKTFQYLGYFYSKDKNHVYNLNEIIEGADKNSFEILPDKHGYAKDKNKVYKHGNVYFDKNQKKIEDVDADTPLLENNFHQK